MLAPVEALPMNHVEGGPVPGEVYQPLVQADQLKGWQHLELSQFLVGI